MKVFDVDLHEGRVFLVLEDVPGSTLEQYAKDRSPDARWSAQTVAAIARAVHLAHEQGIIHQDLNPRNVLIDREGQPRVIDFGMAWSRPWWVESDAPDQIGGTPRYLSPEQANGQADRIGRATDVFGLGGILYFLLTKTSLYSGENVFAILEQAREVSFDRSLLDRPGIPPRFEGDLPEGTGKGARRTVSPRRPISPRRWNGSWPRRSGGTRPCSHAFSCSHSAWHWGLQSYRRGETPTVERPGKPALEVRIWREETQFQPLLQALPVRVGDEVQVRCRVPKGQAVTMYLVDTLGRLRLLKQYPATDDDREIIYPEVEQGERARRSTRYGDDPRAGRVQRNPRRTRCNACGTMGGGRDWPALPPRTVVRLGRDRVEIEGDQSRDLGETGTVRSPGTSPAAARTVAEAVEAELYLLRRVGVRPRVGDPPRSGHQRMNSKAAGELNGRN